MTERKAIVIVLIVAVILFGYYQIPDSPSSNNQLDILHLSSLTPTPTSKKQTRDDETKISYSAANRKKEEQENILLAAPKPPRSPRQAVFSLDKKSIRRYSPSSCSSKVCGCALAQQFGNLEFISIGEEQFHSSYEAKLLNKDSHARVATDYKIVIAQTCGNTTALSWSARAKSQHALFGVVPRKLNDEEVLKLMSEDKKKIIAAWEFDFWLQESNHNHNDHGKTTTSTSSYEIDIVLTWIENIYIGTKWILPNRDDNPPPEVKKKKCLDLQLVGDCERFGLTILSLSVALETPPPKNDVASSSSSSSSLSDQQLPICKSPNQIASQGCWYRIPESELTLMKPQERELIDDFVGLNRFEGGVWRWQPRNCHLNWFAGSHVVSKLIEKGFRQITLFGDSMLLEQFHNFKKLLDPSNIAQIRSKTQNKMRFLSFTTSGNAQDRAVGDTDGIVTVTFLRSYTTSKGKSVIASPKVIASQVAATHPDIIIGNAAVLHWQQNMRSFADWNANIDNLAQRLCSMKKPVLNHFEATTTQHPDTRKIKNDPKITPTLFYFGPTLIQMGRTQGLEPLRTSAFGDAARDAFEKHCRRNNAENDLTMYKFAPFWMYNASIARRESAHDGQHWACYREWGGVAQTFTQMFFNMILN